MLPIVVTARVVIARLLSRRFSLSLQHLGWMTLVGAILFTSVVAANAQGTSNALFADTSLCTRLVRAMVRKMQREKKAYT